MNSFRLQIQCHGNDQGEVWSVTLFDGDVVLASVDRCDHPAAARQAGEYLLFGALSNWIPKLVRSDDTLAGIVPLNAPAEDLVSDAEGTDVDVARVNAIVDAVWSSCIRRLHAEAEGRSN